MTHTLHNGAIALYHGDCLDVMQDIPDQSVDAIICDLPYGTTACKWDVVIPFEPMWIQLKRIIKPRGAIVLFGSQPFTSTLIVSNLKWFKYEWVWDKNTPTGFLNAANAPLKSHENILVFSLGRHAYNPQKTLKNYKGARTGNGFTKSNEPSGRDKGVYGHIINATGFRSAFAHPKTIQQFATGNGMSKSQNIHPTQKPVALLEYLIRTYTNPDETVLDFTFGSCTAGVAALNTKRRFIGIERDAAYYNLGVQRVQDAIDNLPPMDL